VDQNSDATLRAAAWRFVVDAFRREGRYVVAAVAAGLVWQAAAIAAPLLISQAIDDGILGGDRVALVGWCAGLGALGVIEAGCWGLRHFLAIRNGMRTDAAVRDGIFEHSQRLDASYHDRVPPGDLMSRATSDSLLVARLVDNSGHTFGFLLTVVGTSGVLLWLDWQLALILLLPLPFLSIATWRYSGPYSERSKRLQEELGRASTLVEETISGVRVVKGLGAGEALLARFRVLSNRIVERGLDIARLDAVFLPLLELLPLLGLIVVLWFGGTRVIDGDLTLGEFVAFNAYVVLLVWPLRTLGYRVGTVQRGLGAAERITDVLREQPRIVDLGDPAPLEPAGSRGAEVELRGVGFGHDGGSSVLADFRLRVPAGSSLALVGPTGSGKSTVASLLARFYDVREGAVLIDGTDVRSARLADVRRAVGIVFDETFLFNDTVRANIAFGRPEATDEEVEQAARVSGAHDFIVELPHAYDTVLGERGFSLSGGQRQRIAIARALLADPAVLILDDATSAVDVTKEHEIVSALATAMRNRTTLVIAHRPAAIALADRVALLDGGRVADAGTHEELLRRSARYRELLNVQANGDPA
jgi:ATP-binding cassette, subfamily B, bacterial